MLWFIEVGCYDLLFYIIDALRGFYDVESVNFDLFFIGLGGVFVADLKFFFGCTSPGKKGSF